jgi:putative DNA primase/helicase
VACFIAENSYEPSADKHILLKNLYTDYRAFCQEDGASALKKTNFKHRLESNGFAIERFTAGYRVYLEVADA